MIPVEVEGENVLLETFFDITAQKKSEWAKNEFLANMSHELRTPLHGILSFATFGLKKSGSLGPEKLREYFAKIHQSGSMLLQMVNDLLDLAKLESGKMALDIGKLDAYLLIEQIVNEFSSRMAKTNLT